MLFDLTDLRLYAAAAEEQNLTRAAVRQAMSLAAASARIKALEDQAGVALFRREPRGLKLTAAGDAFLHHARAMLHQEQRLRAELQEYGAGLRGHLRVFANTTAVMEFLPELLPAFLAAHPHTNVDLQERPNAAIARGVRDGLADLGIAAGPMDVLGLHATHFSTDRLVLAAPRGHRFARRRRITFAETLAEDAVGMVQGSTLQTFLQEAAERLGKPLRWRIQLASFDAMCRMIGAGVGVGIVPESAARRHRDRGALALVQLTDPWCVRERYVLARDPAQLTGPAQALVQAVLAHFGGSNRR